MTSQPSRRGAPEPPDPLPIAVVDNHTHLDISRDGDEVPVDDLTPVLAEARAVGVDRVVQIGCDLPGARFTVEAADRYAGRARRRRAAPQRGAGAGGERRSRRGLRRDRAARRRSPRVRVVGETGLDYYRTGPEGVPAQQDSFRWHIDLAKRLDNALQIHDRDAHDDVLRVLDEEGAPERTVLHCFSGGPEMARECVERGYYLSFAARSPSRAPRPCATRWPSPRSSCCSSRPTRPTSTPHPWRGADQRARPSCRSRCARWRRCSGVAVPTLCEALSDNAERLYGPW